MSSIPTITLGSTQLKYESETNVLKKKTPDTVKRTIQIFVNNASSVDFRTTETNLLSLKFMGFIDMNATSPPTLNTIEFNSFWEGGTGTRTMYGQGAVKFNPLLVSGMSNLLSTPVLLSSWVFGDGQIKNGILTFKNVVTRTPTNLTGVLYFEIEQSAWT